MYWKRNTEDIINDCLRLSAHHAGAAEAWSKAEVAKKKDGGEFADISRALRGCKRADSFGFEKIAVYFCAAGRCDSDELDIYGYCDQLKDGDPRKAENIPVWHRAHYVFSAEEVRAKIALAIESHKKYAEEYARQAQIAEEAVKKFREVVDAAEKELAAKGQHLAYIARETY